MATAPAGFIEISVESGPAVSGFHSVSAELAEAIRSVGKDPSAFNRMVWPIGASNYASGWFLLHNIPLTERLDDPGVVTLRFGDIVFDKMFIRNPIPLLTSEGSNVVYAVEVVDQRFRWQMQGSDETAFNVHLDDKTKLHDATEDQGPDNPWTPHIALNALADQLVGTTPADFAFPLTVNDGSLDEPSDMAAQGLSIPVLIDKILTSAGYVLVAYPNTAYGTPSFRYEAIRISDGELFAGVDLLGNFSDDILGGGIFAPTDQFNTPSSGAGSIASGASGWMIEDVPSTVKVSFPSAAVDGGPYTFEDPPDAGSVDYHDRRFFTVSTSEGRPDNTPGNGTEIVVHDLKWSIEPPGGGVPDIEAELIVRADLISARYYARFFSGCGDTLLRGIQPVRPFPGGQEIIWSMGPAGPTTRVRGDFNHRLFGYRLDVPLTANDLTYSGRMRAIPRSDNSILFDALEGGAGSIFLGKITAVNLLGLEDVNPQYNVSRAAGGPDIVTDGDPVNRQVNDRPSVNPDNYLEFQAAAVGDIVLLYFDPDDPPPPPDRIPKMIVWEKMKLVDCPPPAPP